MLAVINVSSYKCFHRNRKTQGHKHQLNNLYFKYQVCQMKLRHLNTFLQFRLLFHEPHCTKTQRQWTEPSNRLPNLHNEVIAVVCR